MKRRAFITLLGGAAAAAYVPPVRAQQRERRVGVLMNLAAEDPEGQTRLATFMQSLQIYGWQVGRNLRIDIRWAAGDAERFRRFAGELVALAPDAVLATTSPAVTAMQSATRAIPIVFVQVADPVGAGYVESLARPGGNTTGFMQFEYGLSGKWLELLKEVAPGVRRVAVIRDPAITAGIGQFGALQALASSLSIEVVPVSVRAAGDIERAITAFAGKANGGMIVTASPLATVHRSLITELAAKYKLPAIYSNPLFVVDGGLISYGPDRIEQYRLAAGYVDRILNGTKPTDLPVQAPTKYETLVNLKTAKTLGIQMPASILVRADRVIE